MHKLTRYAELGYRNDAGTWRIVDIYGMTGDEPRSIGPHYRSSAELLADLPRFAAAYGAN